MHSFSLSLKQKFVLMLSSVRLFIKELLCMCRSWFNYVLQNSNSDTKIDKYFTKRRWSTASYWIIWIAIDHISENERTPFSVALKKVVINWIFWPLLPRISSLSEFRSWVVFCHGISIKCTQDSSGKSERLSAIFEVSLILLNGPTVLLWEGNYFKLIKESKK